MVETVLTVLWFAFILGVPLLYALNLFGLVHGGPKQVPPPDDEVD